MASELMDLRERLAALEHNRWARWMAYQFSKGTTNPDGTWTMPAWAVERWQRQLQTPYADLTEQEKASDRAEVDKTLEVLADYVAAVTIQRDQLQVGRDQWRALTVEAGIILEALRAVEQGGQAIHPDVYAAIVQATDAIRAALHQETAPDA